MTTFREYREAMAEGSEPVLALPTLPSDAVEFQGERAGFVSRAVAAGIDVALIVLVVLGTMAVLWVLSFIFDPSSGNITITVASEGRVPPAVWMVLYGYVLNVIYWTVFWATSGRTVGNLVMGLRVINRRGEHPRWWGALLRAMFCTVFPIGLLWVIISGANRSVQDVVLRTSVIYDWVIGIPGLSSKAGSPRPSGRST
jgi:uncharacterized RDD family membrane protein YckC